MEQFVSQDPRSYSLYFDLKIWFWARKVTGTFEKRTPGKLSSFTLKIEVSIVLHLTRWNYQLMKRKWSSLLARTCALILCISIWFRARNVTWTFEKRTPGRLVWMRQEWVIHWDGSNIAFAWQIFQLFVACTIKSLLQFLIIVRDGRWI